MLQYFTGFDGWPDATTLGRKFSLTTSGGYPTISVAGGRRSGNAMRQTYTSKAAIGLTAQDVFVAGFAVYLEAHPSALVELCAFTDSGTAQCVLAVTTDGHLAVYRKDTTTGTLLATSTQVLLATTWYYVEWELTISDASGATALYFDGSGTADVSVTTVDTKQTSNASANGFRFGGSPVINSGVFRTDDFYIVDDIDSGDGFNLGRLGDVKATFDLPTGDGTYTDLAPSSGANYECVDDATPDDDTSYVSDTSGKDTYTYTALAYTPDTVYGTKIEWISKESDATNRTGKGYYKNGATEINSGTAQSMSSDYVIYDEIKQTDTGGTNRWTKATIDATEFGVEVG